MKLFLATTSLALAVFVTSTARAEDKPAAPAQPPAAKPASTLFMVDDAGHRWIEGKVFGDFDQGPVPKFRAVAEYPQQMVDAHVRGKAVVLFTLLENGDTKDLKAMASRKEFVDPAAAAARRTKFIPAKKAGHPVACKVELIYEFPGPMVTGGGSVK